MEVKGIDGTAKLTADEVIITRKGIFSVASPDKNIALSMISAVELKRAGSFSSGYMAFVFNGGVDKKSPSIGLDENAITFNKKDQEAFAAFCEAVRSKVAALRTQGGRAHVSIADELEKLAGLRDRQVISPEEFEAAKRKLLAS